MNLRKKGHYLRQRLRNSHPFQWLRNSIRIKLVQVGNANTHIGKGTTLGRGVIIRGDVTIGKNCYIGDLCVFEGVTTVGDNTLINAQCHITRFSKIGNHVFIAPFFLSTNDNKMTYHRRDHGRNLVGVTIEDNVRIAGHTMTLPGVKIGKGAIVGAYSLVTKDIAPFTFVYGIPAKKHDDKGSLLREDIAPQFEQ
jgi:acetyltransferase-like isoleucine patch superfamily enzyme